MDAVPPPQEDEGSCAQESADVEENGARASPLRVCPPAVAFSATASPLLVLRPKGISAPAPCPGEAAPLFTFSPGYTTAAALLPDLSTWIRISGATALG